MAHCHVTRSGRVQSQFTLSGLRNPQPQLQVSPTEVENTILGVPGVVEVAVGGATSDGSSHLLMALVVKDKDSTVTEEDIHAHVADTLSDYKKLTAGVHFVDSIPKTHSGKIQRKEVNRLAQVLYSGSPR